jgi:formamidopyrimidine-DNA glycosylase
VLQGKIVKKITVVNAFKFKVAESTLQMSLEKQTMKKVQRVGKELHFNLLMEMV